MSGIAVSQLEDFVRKHCPGMDGSVRFRRITTGKFNESYFVTAPDRCLVLRIAPDDDSVFCFYERAMMLQEPGLHRLLRERTSVPVARVIACDDTRGIIDRTAILMERLPGTALSNAGPGVDTDRVFRQVGRMLAEVHSLTDRMYGYLGEHHCMEPRSSWSEAFTVMWSKLVDDIVGVGFYTSSEARAMKSLLGSHLPVFDRDVSSALLHMDIWHQNILVDNEGTVRGIVDWDRALWGDPEIEFAVLDYCGVSTPAFWEGYGTSRDDSPEARLRNVFYLLYEMQKYIVIRKGRGGDPAAAARCKRQVTGLVRRCFG